MEVVESFLSIQGEGEFSGRLAIFVRFAGCNLRCTGFGGQKISPKTGQILLGCDTIKAAQSEHFKESLGYKKLDFNALCELIKSFNAPAAIVVLTGGEPLLHLKNAHFKAFIAYLIEQKRLVQFESNGTICPDFSKFPALKACHFALSVKLANSGESKEKRINSLALKSIFANAKAFYKFVLSGRDDEIDEINEILALQNGQVWLMPLAASKKELETLAPKIAKIAIKSGFNYSDRLHIRLWDSKEGV